MRRQDEPIQQQPHDKPEPIEPQVVDPAPQPTALGAPTVPGAVAAAAMAGRGRVNEPDVRDEESSTVDDRVLEPHPGASRSQRGGG